MYTSAVSPIITKFLYTIEAYHDLKWGVPRSTLNLLSVVSLPLNIH